MDNDALNAALTALVANQQQQQNVLQALANQINNGPAPAPVPFGPAPFAPAKLDLSVRYSGSANESISDWLQLINQKATKTGETPRRGGPRWLPCVVRP